MDDSEGAVVEPRDAGTLVLLRGSGRACEVLMGVRGSGARFMPGRRVFPGGALDAADRQMPASNALPALCHARLQKVTPTPEIALPLALAAIRETFEETGLALGAPPAPAGGIPTGSWRAFCGLGLGPVPDRLRFVFRAITPRRYPVRFDARFFLAPVEAVAGDPDDLSRASGELHDLRWIGIGEALGLDELPFITGIVLREIQAGLQSGVEDRPVPFFSDGRHTETVGTL